MTTYVLIDESTPAQITHKAQWQAIRDASAALVHAGEVPTDEVSLQAARIRLAAVSFPRPHTGADLSGRDFIGRDLRRMDLRGANLRRAALIGADLRGMDLTGADMTGTDLRDADLGGAVMCHVRLDAADLRGAWLGQVNLYEPVGLDICVLDQDQKAQWAHQLAIGLDATEWEIARAATP